MSESGDDHLSMAENELGEPERLFRISQRRFRTKLWLGLGLIAGSIVAIVAMVMFGFGFDAAVLAKLILTPLVIGATILVTMYRQRGLMVLIDPSGLLRLQRGAVASFPWDDIAELRLKIPRLDSAEIRYTETGEPEECWLPSEAPGIMVWQASLTLERADGTSAHISPALEDYDRLVKIVQRRTFPRLWVAARDRLLAGEPVHFGDLEVSAFGLRHGKKKLRWKDFKELAIAQSKLSVKKMSGWVPWSIFDFSKIPNPHVLFALVDVARYAARRPPGAEAKSTEPEEQGERTV